MQNGAMQCFVRFRINPCQSRRTAVLGSEEDRCLMSITDVVV